VKKTSRSTHHTLNELNITPLLDLAFVLLVIFIITTPQLVNNLEMYLPSGKPPPADPNAPKPKINRIVVDPLGQIYLNDTLVSSAELKQTLAQAKQAEQDVAVVVKSSDETDYQNVIVVLDIVQQLDITKVGLATEAAAQ
jgi:biopolymer transport protein ExbD